LVWVSLRVRPTCSIVSDFTRSGLELAGPLLPLCVLRDEGKQSMVQMIAQMVKTLEEHGRGEP
jgi:hypothetical protein